MWRSQAQKRRGEMFFKNKWYKEEENKLCFCWSIYVLKFAVRFKGIKFELRNPGR